MIPEFQNSKTICLIVLILFTMLTFPVFSQKNQEINTIDNLGIRYFESVPNNYHETKKSYPLIIFLHGLGERGDGTDEGYLPLLRHGPMKHLVNSELCVSNGFKEECFILIAPQINKPANKWSGHTVNEIIKFSKINYRIDESRIYLTGLSMGGNGVWNYLTSTYNQPNQIAAAIPFAAWGKKENICNLAKSPISIWAFHGKRDSTIYYNRGKSMIDSFNKCLPENSAKFTLLNNKGHNSWKDAYDPNKAPYIYQWLLKHPDKEVESISPSEIDTAQTNYLKSNKLPSELREASGIISGLNGNFWLHNDSGNLPYLYEIDSEGNYLRKIKITNAANYDWEDITRDHQGFVYIGDIGNNKQNRRSFQIYKIPNPDTVTLKIKAEKIEFSIEDQHIFPANHSRKIFDFEAITCIKDTLYMFSKEQSNPSSGFTRIYKIPTISGNYSLTASDSIFIGKGPIMENWITSATYDDTNQLVYLLSSNKIFIVSKSNWQVKDVINLPTFSQKEGLEITDSGELVIIDELFKNLFGGNIYLIDYKIIR